MRLRLLSKLGWLAAIAFLCGAIFLIVKIPPLSIRLIFPTLTEKPYVQHGPPINYEAVSVAGDASIPAFDNAAAAVLAELARLGTPLGKLKRLSANSEPIEKSIARPATLARVLSTVATLTPAAGEGCFLFLTSHGSRREGFWLSRQHEFLTPALLDQALAKGCGIAPTVVIVSACYSGNFADPPMAKPNRVIITAARSDLTSFGCSAKRTYASFDECLIGTFGKKRLWREAYARILSCVTDSERRAAVSPSEPQGFFGSGTADLATPW